MASQGAKCEFVGVSGSPEPAQGSASCDRKRLLNSPGYSALPPNLPQSFSREVGSFTRRSCRLLELIFRFLAGFALRSGFLNSTFSHSLEAGAGARRQCASARPRGAEPRRKGRIGRGVWDGAGRAALEARTRRVPGLVERAWVLLRPHPSSCRFAGPRQSDSTASPLWVQSLVIGGLFFCRYAQLSGARSLLHRVGQRRPSCRPQPHPVADGFLCNWLSHL